MEGSLRLDPLAGYGWVQRPRSVGQDGEVNFPPPPRRDVVILGSTGSVGTQALELVRANPDRFRVVGLSAGGSNPDLFAAQ